MDNTSSSRQPESVGLCADSASRLDPGNATTIAPRDRKDNCPDYEGGAWDWKCWTSSPDEVRSGGTQNTY